ncbi:hypothetical protein [Rhodopila sp.]|uniref:hypothetical protein n=1 Tax=Rhodopila sp. TaxID=2480087 RepID=UPI003D0D3BC5
MSQSYSEFRARIAGLGLTQSSLARRMKELGDDRDEKNILRSIQRMVAGDARVSGEMRALLGLLEEVSPSERRRASGN